MAGYNQTNNRRPNQSGYGNYQQQQPLSLPVGYLDGGYYKEVQGEKILKKEYIVEYPEEIARLLSDGNESKKGKKNKRSQIRKFYSFTLRVNEMLGRKSDNFASVEGELSRLIYFAKDATSRDKVSRLFEEFIKKNVNAIKNGDDMRAFAKHFEALFAYLPKEKN